MTPDFALLDLARWWLMAGAAVSVLFLTVGIDRVDEDARQAYVFRILLIPGILLIWPLVLWRWLKLELASEAWAARYRPPRAIHLWAAFLLAGLVTLAIFAGVFGRQDWPQDISPQLLEGPDA